MKIGLIGTGLMGIPMAQRLLESGVSVVAYNRTLSKLEPLQQTAAEIVHSVPEVLQNCPAVILMVSDATAIQELVLSATVRSQLAGKTIIQMGTIGPSESKALGQAIQAAGGQYLEAPVLGSLPEVKAGKLLVMVGGTPEQFQEWASLLQCFGSEVVRIGPVGTAAALKLALNQLIAALTTAFALSLGFVQSQGVEVETFMQLLRQSALYAPTFDKKLQRMVDEDYENPNFPTKHLLKDTRLFLKEAQLAGLQIDSLEGVHRILEKAIALGLADTDYSALATVVRSSGLST